MVKKATSFMKKDGKGFIKVWKSKQNGHTIQKQIWATAHLLVLESFDFDLPPGSYLYDTEAGLIKPGEIPDLKRAIPKLRGYKKAQPVMEYNYLKLLQVDSCLLVTFKGRGVQAFVNYDYYQYLCQINAEYTWKVKAEDQAVLLYHGKSLAAVVMPRKLDREEK